MEKGYGQDDPRLATYVEQVFAGGGEDPLLASIATRQAATGMPPIHVSRLDGLHLEVIARAVGAKRAVEIGTLGGWSGICLLRGMGEGALLHTFELDPRHAEVAAESFREAGLSSQVVQHVGPAAERLAEIEREPPFDLFFVDADKLGYPVYLAWAARLLRIGGVVLGDNAFLFGKVCERPEGESAASIHAMQSFNEALARGGRFRATMLPTGEGLAFGVKVR
jgi:caffeoyl-CoA O-methyltransferase